jgi:hypothetical protein
MSVLAIKLTVIAFVCIHIAKARCFTALVIKCLFKVKASSQCLQVLETDKNDSRQL